MPAPTKAIRLNVTQAAGEFGVDVRTLRKRIRQAGIEPGMDQKYSIKQICAAVFGDLIGERTREARLRGDKLELELSLLKKQAIPTERVFEFLQNCFVAIKSKITSSHLSEVEQHQILNDLVGLKDGDL